MINSCTVCIVSICLFSMWCIKQPPYWLKWLYYRRCSMILLWTRCSLCPWPTTSTLGYMPWRFSPWCGTSVKHSGFKQFSIVTASSMPVFLSLMKTSKNKGSTFYNICQALLTINNCLLKSWEMSQLLWTLQTFMNSFTDCKSLKPMYKHC